MGCHKSLMARQKRKQRMNDGGKITASRLLKETVLMPPDEGRDTNSAIAVWMPRRKDKIYRVDTSDLDGKQLCNHP